MQLVLPRVSSAPLGPILVLHPHQSGEMLPALMDAWPVIAEAESNPNRPGYKQEERLLG